MLQGALDLLEGYKRQIERGIIVEELCRDELALAGTKQVGNGSSDLEPVAIEQPRDREVRYFFAQVMLPP